MHGPLVTLALVGSYALFGCAALEIGYRAHSDRPVFALDDWRAARVAYRTFGDQAVFDPVLGWAPTEWYEGDGYNTLDDGIRRNFEEQEIRTGAVLAVGGAFTNGGTDDDLAGPAAGPHRHARAERRRVEWSYHRRRTGVICAVSWAACVSSFSAIFRPCGACDADAARKLT